jgi:hypothetical protein
MLSNDPIWAAGYTTKLDPIGSGETFTGRIHSVAMPEGPTLTARSVHDAEGKLISMARSLSGQEPASLRAAAELVHDKTGMTAILAKNAKGEVTGGILLKPSPVLSTADPVTALKSALERGETVPTNLREALQRTSAPTVAAKFTPATALQQAKDAFAAAKATPQPGELSWVQAYMKAGLSAEAAVAKALTFRPKPTMSAAEALAQQFGTPSDAEVAQVVAAKNAQTTRARGGTR